MGPEGGSGGGMVVAEGTPEQVARPASHTGLFLAPILQGRAALPPVRKRRAAAQQLTVDEPAAAGV